MGPGDAIRKDASARRRLAAGKKSAKRQMPERFIGATPRRGAVRPGRGRDSLGFALKKWTGSPMVAREKRHRPPDGPDVRQQSPALAQGLPQANSDARGLRPRAQPT
jgi:NAD+--asparagine ADP-ribosyltransferase